MWSPAAAVPAIVSRELFDLAQRKLAQNRAFPARNNTRHPYLLREPASYGLCQAARMGRYTTEG